jgi:hypothetical protein
VNDRIAVEIIHGDHEAILELLLGGDAGVAGRSGEFGSSSAARFTKLLVGNSNQRRGGRLALHFQPLGSG